jgi:tetratricopeptide (TPR) repeat protein
MRRILLVALGLVLAVLGAVTYEALARDRDYQAQIARGDTALAEDQTFAAIEAYSRAVARRPDSMLARLRRGEAFQRRGDLEAAVHDFRAATDLDATAVRPREELGNALYQLQRYQEAAEAFETTLSLDDHLTRVNFKLALARYRSGDLKAATALLTRASAANEMTAESYYLLGLCLRDARQLSEAQRAFERAVMLSPALGAAREELADVYASQGKRAYELVQLQVLVGLDPDQDHVERQLAVALAEARAGRTESAVATLGTALDRTPDSPRVYETLGRVWLQNAEARDDRFALKKALEALDRIGTDPRASSDALTLYGRALLRDGQTARAEQVLQQATTRYPLDPSSFTYYAIAAEQLNHLDGARQALIAYGALAGDDAQSASRAMRIAALSLRLNDPASAVRWLQRAADANPSDTKVLAALADAQLRNGDSNRALETIARGLALDAENPTLLTMSRRANVQTTKTSK